MSVYMGDFLGFRLGDEHSYNLNITRVSTNNRYSDSLLPNFNDTTSSVPGQIGTYYWDTQYSQKNFNIDFAFDDLRDEDIRHLSQMLGYKGVKPIIFDEYPHKKYYVKVSAPPTLRYICFDQQEFRIYKGEGSISFVAYYPYAFSVVDPQIIYNSEGTMINNTGDLDAEFKLIYSLDATDISIILEDEYKKQLGILKLSNIIAQDNDVYIEINSRTQLIEGLDENYQKTGHLYNRFIVMGDFFHIPLGRTILKSNEAFKGQYTLVYY